MHTVVKKYLPDSEYMHRAYAITKYQRIINHFEGSAFICELRMAIGYYSREYVAQTKHQIAQHGIAKICDLHDLVKHQ